MADAAGDKAFLEYVEKRVKENAFETPEKGAAFWSNDFDVDQDGKSYSVNKKLAEELTAKKDSTYKVIKQIEPIVDDMWKKDFKYNGEEVSPGAKTKASAMMSGAFAKSAKDKPALFVNSTGATSFFRSSELPAIMSNDNIKNVIAFNRDGTSAELTKSEWYDKQRVQWVDARIGKLLETEKAWTKQTKEWEDGGKKGNAPEPNSYAVGDYAKEVAHAYRNIAAQSKDKAWLKTDDERKADVAKDQALAKKLQETLKKLDNAALRDRVIKETEKALEDAPEARALFQAEILAPEKGTAQAVAPVALTNSVMTAVSRLNTRASGWSR